MDLYPLKAFKRQIGTYYQEQKDDLVDFIRNRDKTASQLEEIRAQKAEDANVKVRPPPLGQGYILNLYEKEAAQRNKKA